MTFDKALESHKQKMSEREIEYKQQEYQEALDIISSMNTMNLLTIGERSLTKPLVAKLQELVDKETPMKVDNKEIENVAFEGYIPIVTGSCQSCECDLTEIDKYCWNCGQRIDWSGGDE